jgi:phospholipase/carboxylesterase
VADDQTTPIYDSGWIYRLHPPRQEGATRLCLMLHGWTGDEYSMDVFLRAIPGSYRVISPRGPVPSAQQGYGWVTFRPGLHAPYPDYQDTARKLSTALEDWIRRHQLPDERLTLIGFSQGAGMALSFALTFPNRVERVACLSGFLPQNGLPPPESISLTGLKVFISHGALDKIVPLENARLAAAWLKAAGAEVITCQTDVGHRLSASCHRGLKEFLA